VESRLQNLKSNLRYLCGYHRSVAEVCRRVAINRQQFNKYLAGANMPSDYNLRKICQFFEVDPGSLFNPHAKFVAGYEGSRSALTAASWLPDGGLFPPSDERLRKYCGSTMPTWCRPPTPTTSSRALPGFLRPALSLRPRPMSASMRSSGKTASM
jgi:transcriptional regulator with XRE-family HTH domain